MPFRLDSRFSNSSFLHSIEILSDDLVLIEGYRAFQESFTKSDQLIKLDGQADV